MKASPLPLNNSVSLAVPSVAQNEVCPSCGDFIDERGLDETTGWCYECTATQATKKLQFLRSVQSEQAVSFRAARQQNYSALHNNGSAKPTCIVCGEIIARSRNHVVFCRRHAECRRYSRRYVYLYTERGKSKAEALSIILEELGVT